MLAPLLLLSALLYNSCLEMALSTASIISLKKSALQICVQAIWCRHLLNWGLSSQITLAWVKLTNRTKHQNQKQAQNNQGRWLVFPSIEFLFLKHQGNSYALSFLLTFYVKCCATDQSFRKKFMDIAGPVSLFVGRLFHMSSTVLGTSHSSVPVNVISPMLTSFILCLGRRRQLKNTVILLITNSY